MVSVSLKLPSTVTVVVPMFPFPPVLRRPYREKYFFIRMLKELLSWVYLQVSKNFRPLNNVRDWYGSWPSHCPNCPWSTFAPRFIKPLKEILTVLYCLHSSRQLLWIQLWELNVSFFDSGVFWFTEHDPVCWPMWS